MHALWCISIGVSIHVGVSVRIGVCIGMYVGVCDADCVVNVVFMLLRLCC